MKVELSTFARGLVKLKDTFHTNCSTRFLSFIIRWKLVLMLDVYLSHCRGLFSGISVIPRPALDGISTPSEQQRTWRYFIGRSGVDGWSGAGLEPEVGYGHRGALLAAFCAMRHARCAPRLSSFAQEPGVDATPRRARRVAPPLPPRLLLVISLRAGRNFCQLWLHCHGAAFKWKKVHSILWLFTEESRNVWIFEIELF